MGDGSYCAKANIVIELDGSQHYEYEGLVNDEKRTAYSEQYGIKVIRISNLDILKNFEGVCMHIDNAVVNSLKIMASNLYTNSIMILNKIFVPGLTKVELCRNILNTAG